MKLFKRCVKKGYRRAELSWILEDSHLMNRALETMGAKVYKRYRLYDYRAGLIELTSL